MKLKEAVALCSRIKVSKGVGPLFSSICEGVISATNLDLWIRVKIDEPVVDGLVETKGAAKLAKVGAPLIYVEGGKELPAIGWLGGIPQVKIRSEELRKACEKVLVIGNYNFYTGEKDNVVKWEKGVWWATDGHRLIRENLGNGFVGPNYLPWQVIELMGAVMKKEKGGEVEIRCEGDLMQFSVGDVKMLFKMEKGRFPDCEVVLERAKQGRTIEIVCTDVDVKTRYIVAKAKRTEECNHLGTRFVVKRKYNGEEEEVVVFDAGYLVGICKQLGPEFRLFGSASESAFWGEAGETVVAIMPMRV